MIYPDTSFLLPLYVHEEWSVRANRMYQERLEPLQFTPFHRLELRSALRGRVFRKSMTLSELKVVLNRHEADFLDGVLRHIPLDWNDALREAERLGAAHLTQTGARSGDLLHVASAVVLGAREFLTFDERQANLARRAGLKVKG